MTSRRAVLVLSALPLGLAALLLRPIPPAAAGEAAQAAEAVPGPLPAACAGRLPLPGDFELRKPEYERLLAGFLGEECYARLGWRHDRQIRPSGPTLASLGPSATDPHLTAWTAQSWATHGSVFVYYSPDVYRWMCERDAAGKRQFVDECRRTCPQCRLDGLPGPDAVRPIADGEMIVKLMYGTTTEDLLRHPEPAAHKLLAVPLMVKDHRLARDGWWWGTWAPPDQVPEAAQIDWPPPVNFPYPWMGSGYYCVNCHASAAAEMTFSNLGFVAGDPEELPTFYLQDEPPLLDESPTDAVEVAADPTEEAPPAHERLHPHGPPAGVNRVSAPLSDYSREFLAAFGARRVNRPTWKEAGKLAMPPEPYDHVVAGASAPPPFLTSDQCVGCHAAGSTGMHFDMTVQPASQAAYQGLINIAPYGEWRASPMGLAGRDPIFFAQLETERTLHAGIAPVVQDLCLHCHGVMGQRQFCLDQFPGDPEKAARVCDSSGLLGLDADSRPIVPRELFSRAVLDAVPYQAVTPEQRRDSRYAALARDGVSCTVCHHVQLDEKTPIGHTFTGDFRTGPADALHGPFADPKTVPMDTMLGAKPVEYAGIRSSKVCGSCHAVVLPVFDGSKPYRDPRTGKPQIIIEQATYPEWVLSDFRDDGPTPRSCQSCHMPSSFPGLAGTLRSRIASIQEASNMPQTENRRPRAEIDVEPREPYARHALVGLNVFFNRIAQQFPDVLGIRIQDPMLAGRGVAPLATTYESMIQQADTQTAEVAIQGIGIDGGRLVAEVQVANLAGHKLPSGVGFRRLFLELAVLDAAGKPLWVSGRTGSTGEIVDERGRPVAGERLWGEDCKPLSGSGSGFQPTQKLLGGGGVDLGRE